MRVTELRNRYAGETCYVVGKGVSLLAVTRDDFDDGVVVTLNQAIVPVERLGLSNPTYSMQKDAGLVRPERATLLVHEVEASRAAFPDYRPRYSFNNPEDFGLEWSACSMITAVKLAELLGCARALLMCCDACTNQDTRGVVFYRNGSYFIEPGNSAYLEQCVQLARVLAKTRVATSFVWPK